jgi:hypothetical protein
MAQHDKRTDAPAEPPPPAEANVTLPASSLADLIASKVRDEVARIMTATTVDERMRTAMDAMRGRNIPPPPETMVECRSPLTGARFRLRATTSKTYPAGRVVEMLDYERPAGWDAHKEDGGLYEGPREFMALQPQTNRPGLKYTHWVYTTFWQTDWNAVSGKPLSYLAQWRAPLEMAQAAE